MGKLVLAIARGKQLGDLLWGYDLAENSIPQEALEDSVDKSILDGLSEQV